MTDTTPLTGVRGDGEGRRTGGRAKGEWREGRIWVRGRVWVRSSVFIGLHLQISSMSGNTWSGGRDGFVYTGLGTLSVTENARGFREMFCYCNMFDSCDAN